MNSPQYDYDLLAACGRDVFISANVEIRRPHLVKIGKAVAIDTGFYCTTGMEVGDYVHISPYITVIGGEPGFFRMGNFTGMAAGCRIICASHEQLGDGLIGPTAPPEYADTSKVAPVIFETFASTGTNVVVMPGITLGEGSVVGACALVTKDTEPWTIYTGIPARPQKERARGKMLEYARELGYDV